MLIFRIVAALMFGAVVGAAHPASGATSSATERARPGQWRAGHRIIDLHQHIDCTTQHLARSVKIMDAVGIGIAVNLSGGTVTRSSSGGASEFEQNKRLTDLLYPGRFLHYMNLDYSGWDEPGFAERAVQQIEEGHRLGAAGLKEFKRLGLFLRDKHGRLLRVDDPKLDPVWERCGQLNMPVSIHVADPKAFWLPYDSRNERWQELKDHPSWWFGDTNKFPAWRDLLEALNRVVARHPRTTFVAVHFANNAEELDWVARSLAEHPNLMADLAARIPELGRHNPTQTRDLFTKYSDRIFFATDFQVYDRLILGSSGNEPAPTDSDAEVFFAKEWRWLETKDRNWPHMTPIQGNWTISSIGLPAPVLRKIYFDNARKLLSRSLPAPTLNARRISQDFEVTCAAENPLWLTAQPARLEQSALDADSRAKLSTLVSALWSERYLYLAFDAPYTRLTVFDPLVAQKRVHLDKPGQSLWDRDVVEAFLAPDPTQPLRYAEFEVAPTNEKLDVLITQLPNKDFQWQSGFTSATRVDRRTKRWRCEMKIPIASLTPKAPTPGAVWRANFYRCDLANRAFLAWNPPLQGSFHAPARFGALKFVD